MILPIKKILCPTDFSEPSYEGLKVGNELAVHFGAELILIHVISIVQIAPFTAADMLPELLKDAEVSAQNYLNKAAEDFISKEVKVRSLLFQASPAEEIARAAEKHEVDLIVIATHGQSGWKKFFSGSVAEKVVRLADRPVLTIQGPEEGSGDV